MNNTESDRDFGRIITRLIQRENLTREEAKEAFFRILNNETTEMQQGAFFAARTAKGGMEGEVAGSSGKQFLSLIRKRFPWTIRRLSLKTAAPAWIPLRPLISVPPLP